MNESKDTEHTFARSTDLVLVQPIGSRMEPYTTTDKIAEFAEVSRKAVNQLLRRHLKDLEQFGKVEFEMEPLRGSRTGQRVKNAHLNEQQATLFITYLQNTPPVRRFKKRLVHDFFAMREELTKRRTLREVGKPVQRELTDAIRDSGEAERMHGHAFNTYTNLIYRAALGQTAPQVKKARGAAKDARAVDFLTSDELRTVEKKKRLVTDLLDDGYSYEAIREFTGRCTSMPRERKGFRDQLENIIAAHPQGEQMSVKEVAKYCGRDERTVAKQFPFVG